LIVDEENKSGVTHSELVLAVDLGGTNLRVAAVDRTGKIHCHSKQRTPQTGNADEIVRALIDALRACASTVTEQGGAISAVSIVVPGTVDIAEGVVVKVPNLPCLDGFQLCNALGRELGWPVFLENDANAAAIGERWLGAGKGYATLICVTLGTGVGGGIILDGKLWRGVDGSAAEIGHIGVDPFSGVNCTCGSEGCLEVFASATAVVRMAHEARFRHPNSVLHHVGDLTAEQLYQAGRAGDELAIEVFHRMGDYLGVGLASLINLLNPQVIVIGGGLANGWDLFQEHMNKQVSRRAFPVPARRAKIVRAQCGDDAGLIGAARIVFKD
jgi:glucokinase